MRETGAPDGPTARRRVLIINQGHQGHPLVYVRLLVDAALERSDGPVVALPDAALRSPEFTLHLGEVADRCEIVRLADPITPELARQLAERHACGRVLVPDGDQFATRLGLVGWRGAGDVVTLVIRDPRLSGNHRLRHRVKMVLKGALLRRAGRLPRVRVLFLADHAETARRGRDAVADPILFDAMHLDPLEIRRDLGLSEDRFYFVVAGKITARKNLDMVLRGILPLADAKVGLFACGELSPDVRTAIAPLLERARQLDVEVVLSDRLQSNHELNRAVQMADCLVTAYSNSAPPSTTTKGARAGRRVVVAGSEVTRMWARNLGIELHCPLEQQPLDALLRRALSTPVPPPIPGGDPRAFAEAFLC
ncbi:hypothetical protein [Micromonospora sp. RTGN7]|uniref:hypothetical protein n=1 Tax=Micromonospora sp. RTGN7 TaxID=3016526 RepID=UPI0029FF0B82|nr:hypothetical protein [Micromonospora sp. RTGN7]